MKLRRVFKRAGALMMAGLMLGIPAVAAGVGASESVVAYADTGSEEVEQTQLVITVSENEAADHKDDPEDVKKDDPEDVKKESTENDGVNDPGAEEPKAGEPGNEEPGKENPGTEEPEPEEPKSEAPVTEEPGTDEPKITPTPTPVPDDPEPEPICICKNRCSKDHVNEDCPVCSKEYTKCAYVNPVVQISINPDAGWYTDKARVHVDVKDLKETGNFTIYSVEAKVGQNGTWTDIADEMFIEVSENCTVYVKVTDQNNIAYEKNKAVHCFDNTKPTFNAAVNDGVLTVQASDTQSGVKAVYVNGYEYKDLTNGTLTVRLQSFDASYEYFSIKAMDNAGNVADTEKVKNPYYGKDDKASELPVSAQPTHPTTAQAAVTSHAMTDSSGNTTADTAMSIAKQKKQAMAEADKEEKEEKIPQSGMDSVVEAGNENKEPSMTGKEFYTIQTDTEKVFYLIVDRDGNEEKVYFLTEICENDLLNATSDNSETLPMNSIGAESAIPVEEKPAETESRTTVDTSEATNTEQEEPDTEEDVPEPEEESGIPLAGWIVLIVIGIGFIAAAYYIKVVKNRDEGFLDEDDDTSEDVPVKEETEITEESEYGESDENNDGFLDGYEEEPGNV